MTSTQHRANGSNRKSDAITLELTIKDPEIVAELERYPAGDERNHYAHAALRVGVLALRQANGLLDADVIRREGDRMLFSVKEMLTAHATNTTRDISSSLRRYFDPSDGELPQRLNRLVSRDGELEQLLARHVGNDASTLTTTLERHIGKESPLLQTLSPDQGKGIMALLRQMVETALGEQAKCILRQFSLDDRESALSRLVGELTDKNGQLRKELSKDVETVRKEFSLDNEEGALSRLMSRVEAANKTIMDEFSRDNENSAISRMTSLLESTNKSINASLTLDNEDSPLARLSKELRGTIDKVAEANNKFHLEVRESLAELKTRREEAARSTTHGLDFEDALGEFLCHEANRLNDVFDDTSDNAGVISRCKVGDHVVQLGPDSAAPGSRIVFEAKGNKSYDVPKALEELSVARQNREAQVGVLVFAPSAAPEGMEVLNRWGEDIIVVWDPENAEQDVFLRAALSLARAMAVADRRVKESAAADFSAIEASANAIIRDAEILNEIQTHATTVKNSGEKIVKKAERLKGRIDEQVECIQSHLEAACPSA